MSRWKGLKEKACHVRLRITVSDTTHVHKHLIIAVQTKWTWDLLRQMMTMMKVLTPLSYHYFNSLHHFRPETTCL